MRTWLIIGNFLVVVHTRRGRRVRRVREYWRQRLVEQLRQAQNDGQVRIFGESERCLAAEDIC